MHWYKQSSFNAAELGSARLILSSLKRIDSCAILAIVGCSWVLFGLCIYIANKLSLGDILGIKKDVSGPKNIDSKQTEFWIGEDGVLTNLFNKLNLDKKFGSRRGQKLLESLDRQERRSILSAIKGYLCLLVPAISMINVLGNLSVYIKQSFNHPQTPPGINIKSRIVLLPSRWLMHIFNIRWWPC